MSNDMEFEHGRGLILVTSLWPWISPNLNLKISVATTLFQSLQSTLCCAGPLLLLPSAAMRVIGRIRRDRRGTLPMKHPKNKVQNFRFKIINKGNMNTNHRIKTISRVTQNNITSINVSKSYQISE